MHRLWRPTVRRWTTRRRPRRRLPLKAPGLQHEAERAALLAAGRVTARLDLQAPGPLADYLADLGRVDIALDPFPYNGGMTTLDGLWMGVPMRFAEAWLALVQA